LVEASFDDVDPSATLEPPETSFEYGDIDLDNIDSLLD
jgi:hypothetical protein